MKAEVKVIAQKRQQHDLAVYSQLILTMVIWGAAWPVGRLLAQGLPTISIAVVRYAIVVPVLFVALQIREQKIGVPRSQMPTLLVLGLFSTTLYQAFFLYGVKYAAASDDSIVIGVGPVIIAVLASIYAQENLTRQKIAGFIAGLSGVLVISLLSPNTGVPNRLLGVSLVFGGAMSYAIYTTLLRRFVNKNKQSGQQISSLSILAWMSLFGSFVMLPFSLVEQPWTATWDPKSWLGILYLALISTVIGYFFYVEGVSKIGASRAAIFGNLIPVAGVVSSYLLLGEKLSIWHLFSFLLIFVGVYLVNSKQLRKHSAESG